MEREQPKVQFDATDRAWFSFFMGEKSQALPTLIAHNQWEKAEQLLTMMRAGAQSMGFRTLHGLTLQAMEGLLQKKSDTLQALFPQMSQQLNTLEKKWRKQEEGIPSTSPPTSR